MCRVQLDFNFWWNMSVSTAILAWNYENSFISYGKTCKNMHKWRSSHCCIIASPLHHHIPPPLSYVSHSPSPILDNLLHMKSPPCHLSTLCSSPLLTFASLAPPPTPLCLSHLLTAETFLLIFLSSLPHFAFKKLLSFFTCFIIKDIFVFPCPSSF